jgi:hypothetical protein
MRSARNRVGELAEPRPNLEHVCTPKGEQIQKHSPSLIRKIRSTVKLLCNSLSPSNLSGQVG